MKPKSNEKSLASLLLVLGLAAVSRLPERFSKPARTPLQAGVHFVVIPFSSPLARCSAWMLTQANALDPESPAKLAERLHWLEQENTLLHARIQAQVEAGGWYERLRPLIEGAAFTPVPATVANWNGNWKDPRLTLTRGRQAGLVPRQIVVGRGAELIGVIGDEIGTLTADVQLACRPNARLQAVILPHASDVTEGDAPDTKSAPATSGTNKAPDEHPAPPPEKNPLRLRLVGTPDGLWVADAPQDAEIALGDVAVLDDPNWPFHTKGFRLGVVEKMISPHPDPQLGLFFRQLVIRPAADPNLLGQVLVLVPKADPMAPVPSSSPADAPHTEPSP